LGFFWLTVSLFLGCQGSSDQESSRDAIPSPVTKAELSIINIGYHEFCADKGKPPRNLDDLAPYIALTEFPQSRRKMEEECLRQLKEGKYLVLWNRQGVWEAKEGTDIITACEQRTGESGGFVVFADGRVKWLSREEYQKATPAVKNGRSRPSAASPPEPQWGRQFTPDKFCSAEFPGIPTTAKIDLNGIDLHRLTLQRDAGKGHYALTFMRQPDSEAPAVPEDFLDEWRDNNLAMPVPGGGQFKLIRECKVQKDGVVGRQVDLQAGPDKVSLNRVFVCSRGVYRLNVVIDSKRQADKDVRRFLDSVRFHQ
jgi:hypothetical protein